MQPKKRSKHKPGFPQRLTDLILEWLNQEGAVSSMGMSRMTTDIAGAIAQASHKVKGGYQHAFIQVLAMELMEAAEGVTTQCDRTVALTATGADSSQAQVQAGLLKKRKRTVVVFPGSFDLRGDSELLDLGYSTKDHLSEKQRRDILLLAYKAPPGAGGRTGGTEFWAKPGTPQRLSAISWHLHHLMTYSLDRRTPHRERIEEDLDWLKQVLYSEGSGITWPIKKIRRV